MSALPIRDLLRFMARAAAAAGQAARVVTSVADTIQGAPADAESQRQLRDLAELHQDLELRAHQLETRLVQLADEDARDDAALEERVSRISGRVDVIAATVRTFTARLDAFGMRLEELAGAAAGAGTFRQLEDQDDGGRPSLSRQREG